MTKSQVIKHSILSITIICVVVAVVFLASTITAHGCSYYDNSCGGYAPAPIYSYGSSYQYPPSQPIVSPIIATCYSQPLSTYVGNTVQWTAQVTGGVAPYSYNITWIGDEGLSGYGSTISKVYNSIGTKNASIQVISGGQTVAVNCSNSINVSDQSYSYYPNYYNNNNNYNYSNYSSYTNPVAVSCVANTTSTGVGSTVTWSAMASGGSGYYTYSWSGTDGLYGASQYTTFTYNNPGVKNATVVVSSNGQTSTGYCSSSVNVSQNYNGYYNSYNPSYIITQNSNNGLDIGCYSDPASVAINQPVTWNVEVTGGVAPYTYSWTGTNGLTGNQSSVIKYYSTSGSKNAIVTVKSADGKTGTRACSNALTVRGAASNGTVTTVITTSTSTNGTNNTPNTNPNGTQLSAASIFSFDNVPWGWIAILIILVLFATVMYLLFNRQKI